MLAIQKNLSKSFFVILSLPATSMGFALSVQISALSWILTTKYGLDIHDVGLVWAAGPLAGIIGQVLIGVISDKVWFWNGRRRPFILIGGVLASLSLLALPSIGVISSALGFDGVLGVAIAIALTLDLAINVSFNPTRAIIADVTPEGQDRTRGYTWMQTISGSFGVMAYAIGAMWGNYVLIYFGAVLVLVFSIIPTFFVSEPKELNPQDDSPLASAEQDKVVSGNSTENKQAGQRTSGIWEMLMLIQPLWGFLIYDVYAMSLRLAGIDVGHYYVEFFCALLTIFLVAKVILKSERSLPTAEAGILGFKKVLAAHSFSWIGVQAMFVYMVAYTQHRIPSLTDTEMGQVVSISFLILNAVAAVLPAFVLAPMAEKYGRVRTHASCLAIMALGYFALVIFGTTPLAIYLLMAVIGVGWGAIVSLPFAIMSQQIDQARMGLFMGLFNLSVVLPQLLVSLGIGLLISKADDKSLVFVISAVSLAISALAWHFVQTQNSTQQDQGSALSAGSGH